MTRFVHVLAFSFSIHALFPATPQAQTASPARTGVVLLAHGGSESWDANVHAIASEVDRTMPTEVALGMANRASIQGAVARLEARGVTAMIAVPLFVSSHSSVITSTEYLLGLRKEMPAALKVFAKMTHGAPGDHGAHSSSAEDGTRPIQARVPIRMSPALDAHPLVAAIVSSRAKEISETPSREAVVLVAHGPNEDDVNDRWLANLHVLAGAVKDQIAFASIDALTVRDDAPQAVRDAATRELRGVVEKRRADGYRVLIVPVLLSYGGIEKGLRTRLEGLEYTMTTQALAPDARLVEWVLAMARTTRDSSSTSRSTR